MSGTIERNHMRVRLSRGSPKEAALCKQQDLGFQRREEKAGSNPQETTLTDVTLCGTSQEKKTEAAQQGI